MDETEPDCRSIDAPLANQRSISDAATAASSAAASASGGKKRPKIDPAALCYDMTGEKFLVIFNHFAFEKSIYYLKRPTTRHGTHQDVLALKRVFGRLGFKIFTYTDLKYDAIIDAMTNIANHDHTFTSCLAVVILTHGDKYGVVYAADRGYFLKDLISILKTGHIGLVNKPKLFFIEAGRGNKLDEGKTVRLDGSDEEFVVPSHIDFLTKYSSVDGYVSWRHIFDGSYMIQELCKTIAKHHNDMDLLELITLTNRNVVYLKKKQTPESRFTLTKLSSISDAATAASSAAASANGGKKSPKFDPAALHYDMTGEKFLYIFNHYQYERTRYFNYKRPASREGTYRDVLALKFLFSKLGFKIITYTDLEHDAIIDAITEIANQDHTLTSCLAVVILTHGGNNGVVFAADRRYHLKEIISILETGHIGLVNKLNLFFIQACRGGKRDEGRTIRFDGSDEEGLVVSSHADFLIMHSTVDGHVSWRDADGSWMIQELCEAIDNHHNDMDLLQLITLTTRNVAYLRASNTPSDMKTHNKKQTPETRLTLTKLVQF